MSTLACFRAMQLAARSRSGLDEADRLRLEQHLEECARCTADAQLLEAVVERAGSVRLLDGAARQRAFARATQRHAEGKPVRSVAAGAQRALVFAAAACALVLIAFFAWPSKRPPVEVVGSVSAVQPAEPRSSIKLAAGATMALEHASATGLRDSEFFWDAETATVTLSGGSLRFEVEPGRTLPFQVVTKDYRVEVLGTIFEVDAGEVRVERGKVRVERTGGESARQILTAGERWSLAEVAAAPSVAPAPPASASASTTPSAAPPKNVTAMLARARALLSEGKVSAARSLVEQAQAAGLAGAQDAEARTLLAECALVSGDPKEAARRYGEVARKYGDLAAGETALFAAGRSAHAAGQKEDARKIFNQYLARYPKGQFVNEARTRLAQLGQ